MMRDAWMLVRIQWTGMFGFNRALHGQRRVLELFKWFALTFVIVLALPNAVGMYCYLMASGLNALGQLRLFPSAALAVSAAFTLVTAVPKAGDSLLTFKDYDRVLSLPVSLRAVAASRVLLVITTETLYSLMVLLPAGAVYAWLMRPAAAFYPIYILLTVVAAVIPSVVGGAIGVLISRLAAGRRGGKALHLIVLLAVTLGFMAFSMTSSPEHMMTRLTDFGGLLAGAIDRIYPLAPLFTSAIADLNWGAAALFIALSLAGFWGAVELLALVMRPAHERLASVRTGVGGRRGALRMASSSPLKALYVKEMKRYFASVIYVFNTAFGSLLMLVGAVALSIMGLGKLLDALEIAVPGGIPTGALLAAALSMMAITVDTTGTSISLEGSSVWILKSLPLPAVYPLCAKALVCLTMTLPFIAVAVVILSFALPLSLIDVCLMLLLPSLYALFIALFGLWYNLHWHRFDWPNETVVVKQSMGALIPLLAGFILLAAPVMLYIRFPAIHAEWLAGALVAAVDALLVIYLAKRGDELVRAL